MELKNQKQIIARLKRIEGQVRGLQKMIESEKSCSDIIIQVSAVQSALKMVSRKLFEDYASTCLLEFQKVATVSGQPNTEKMKDMQEKLTVLSEFIGQLLMSEKHFTSEESFKSDVSDRMNYSSEGEAK
jgi:DNA-binding FrmR family transcriptional regulator